MLKSALDPSQLVAQVRGAVQTIDPEQPLANVRTMDEWVSRSLEGRRIETVNISDPVPAMDVGLAWRRNMELTPPMLAFRSYFQQAFQLPEH